MDAAAGVGTGRPSVGAVEFDNRGVGRPAGVMSDNTGRKQMAVVLGEKPMAGDERDAIHVAVVPMVASEMLRPGQRVGVLDGELAGPSEDVVGVVDPYLTDVVFKGERFWLCLLPNTVTGMRHHWSHPVFSAAETSTPSKEQSKAWLTEFAKHFEQPEGCKESYGDAGEFGYDELIEAARAFVEDGEYHTCRGFDTPEEASRYTKEMWGHIRNVVDFEIPDSDTDGHFFTCSC